MESLDGSLRANSPYGQPMDDYQDFYAAANGMMYNSVVTQAFSFAAADSVRYGSSGTGNAMLVASQVLKANQGTRFIQITSNDGWDMHQNIYAATNLPAKGKLLDTALSSLIADLKASGLFNSTLIVMVGLFLLQERCRVRMGRRPLLSALEQPGRSQKSQRYSVHPVLSPEVRAG